MMEKPSYSEASPKPGEKPAAPADTDRFAEACREPERFVRPTIDALPGNIAILDERGRIRMVNDGWRAFAERNGVSADTVSEGANYLKICDEAAGPHAAEAKPFAAAIRRILAGEKTPYRREYPCHSPDKKRWFLGCVAPFPNNGTGRVLVAHFDISETKRMRRVVRDSERRFRDAFVHAPIGMALLDEDGRFLHVNAAYCRITGYTAQELRQPEMTFRQLSHPDDLPETLAELQRMKAGRIPAFFTEKRYRRKDGTLTWVRISASLRQSPNGGSFQIVSLVEDINERKQAEAALRRSNQELEEFAYVASHDLQEPLRSVVGFLQLLQQRYEAVLDEKGRHYIERSVHAGRRMQTLIKDLLVLSRVHTKGAQFRPTDLNQALQKVLEHLESFLRKKDAVVDLTPLPTLAVDESQILSLFQNLIVNGVKYNENPRPRVDIAVREASEGWHFTVEDNGIGIAERYHARIFLVFQRLHTDREYPGTGLGLALCQKIVERHGGRIWVASQPGRGSTFHFTLPRKPLKGSP